MVGAWLPVALLAAHQLACLLRVSSWPGSANSSVLYGGLWAGLETVYCPDELNCTEALRDDTRLAAMNLDPALLALAILLAYQLIRALRIAWMRHSTGKPFEPRGRACGWNIDYQVVDAIQSKKLRNHPVVPNLPAPLFFGGGYDNNILMATGAEWRDQKALLHPFIVRRATAFEKFARSTTVRLPSHGHRVWLPRAIGEHAASVSAAALGTECRVDVVDIWYRGIVGVLLTWYIADWWRGLSRWLLRRTTLDRQLQAFVQTTVDPEVLSMRERYGDLNTVGNLWAVSLGSTLPETSVTCDILHELAGNAATQSTVRRWLQEGGKDDGRFAEWISGRCREYVFFKFSKPRFDDDGAAAAISLEAVRAPFGVGKRRCPGARIGERTVGLIVADVLIEHQLTIARAPCLPHLALGIHHLVAPCLVNVAPLAR